MGFWRRRLDKARESLEPSTPRWLGTSPDASRASRLLARRSSIDAPRIFAQSNATGVVVIADLGTARRSPEVAENMGGVADMLKNAPRPRRRRSTIPPTTAIYVGTTRAGGVPAGICAATSGTMGSGGFGLHRNRHRHLHGIAIKHPVRESHRAVRVAGRPGVRIGGVHSIHHPRAGFAWTRSPTRRRVRSASLRRRRRSLSQLRRRPARSIKKQLRGALQAQ